LLINLHVGSDSKNLELKNCKLKLQEKIKSIKKNIFKVILFKSFYIKIYIIQLTLKKKKNTKKEKESLGSIRDVYKKLKYSKRKLNNYQDKFFSQQIKVTKFKKEVIILIISFKINYSLF